MAHGGRVVRHPRHLVEPGGFSTDWAGPSAKRATPLPDYDEVHAKADYESRLTLWEQWQPVAELAQG